VVTSSSAGAPVHEQRLLISSRILGCGPGVESPELRPKDRMPPDPRRPFLADAGPSFRAQVMRGKDLFCSPDRVAGGPDEIPAHPGVCVEGHAVDG